MIYENINIPLWNALKHASDERILDIGCGTGALGELLKSQKNHVEGITYSHEEARIASTRLDQVHVLDLNQLPDGIETLHGSFDVLILGDVLEHLLAPVETLKTLLALLSHNGTVYVSLPNVACFYVRLGLLAGRFNMSPYGGILDETHLHFYTLASAKRMLSQAGLSIECTYYMPAMSVWAYQFVRKPNKGGAAPKKDNQLLEFYTRYVFPVESLVAACWPGMLANQFVFACSPK